MRNIENVTQLRLEYARLKLLKIEQEAVLKKDLDDVVESLKPVNILINLAADVFEKKNNNSVFQNGLNLGLNFIANRFLPKGAAGILQSIVSYASQNLSATISSKSRSVFDSIKTFFKFGKKKEPMNDNNNNNQSVA